MRLLDKVTSLSSSAHTGRALKAAKFLNLVGTVRGAITTVLLASSAIGGAVTVNNVRQDITKDQNATPTAARVAGAKTTPPPTPTPLTAQGLRSDAEKRLRLGLDQDAAGADDLRKVSILGAGATDSLIALTRQKLQNRFDQALGQVDALLAPASPAPSGTPPPSPSLSVVAVNSLVQVALADMSGILFVATKTATEVVAIQTPRPTAAPTTPVPTPVRTPPPTQPPRTPSPTPTPRPTSTR
jgi:hypothetical protein